MPPASTPGTRPLISVIIPCFNYGHFLGDAVRSALSQRSDELDVDIIIVDDGSTDDTARVAQGFGAGVRYIHQENQGPSAARNSGIRAARGDFLLFLDADDTLSPGNLASHLRTFALHPELDLSVCRCLLVGENKAFPWPLKAEHLDTHLCHSNISPVHTFLARAGVIGRAGLFDAALPACEDQEFWLRCAAKGCRLGVNPAGMVIYRQHGAGLTANRPQQRRLDAEMRFLTERLLDEAPGLPRAGKYMGWLACGAGTLLSALGVVELLPDMSVRLLERAGQDILKAAGAAAPPQDAHLALAEEYFAIEILSCLRPLAPSLTRSAASDLSKALRFMEHRFRRLAVLDEDTLQVRRQRLLKRLLLTPSKTPPPAGQDPAHGHD